MRYIGCLQKEKVDMLIEEYKDVHGACIDVVPLKMEQEIEIRVGNEGAIRFEKRGCYYSAHFRNPYNRQVFTVPELNIKMANICKNLEKRLRETV